MFDIGFWELLLIGIVALVVVGPERLPEVARTAGVYIAKLRRFVAGVKSDINAELETGELKQLLGDQRDQIRELKDIVDDTRREMESSASSTVKSVKEFSTSVEDSYKSLGPNFTQSPSDSTSTDKPSESSQGSSAETKVENPTATTTATDSEKRILADAKPSVDTEKSSSDSSMPDVSDKPANGQSSNG